MFPEGIGEQVAFFIFHISDVDVSCTYCVGNAVIFQHKPAVGFTTAGTDRAGDRLSYSSSLTLQWSVGYVVASDLPGNLKALRRAKSAVSGNRALGQLYFFMFTCVFIIEHCNWELDLAAALRVRLSTGESN